MRTAFGSGHPEHADARSDGSLTTADWITIMRRCLIFFTALLTTSCSSGNLPALAPHVAPQGVPGRIYSQHLGKIVNHYSCPARGSLVYVSDYNNDVINVYNGNLAGQAPCGQIGSPSSLSAPDGLYLQSSTHDLYVANRGSSNIKVFHRGQLTPFNTYLDENGYQFMDSVVAKDGTLIATSIDCTLSTWLVGSNGGTYVGTFGVDRCEGGYPAYITVDKNSTFYFDAAIGGQLDPHPALLIVSCPHGACGEQTRVWWHVGRFSSPEGMAFDAAGDLLMTDLHAHNDSTADTFELPNPNPKTFSLSGTTEGMAIDSRDNHWFVANAYGGASEYAYPGGALIGTVTANTNGYMSGIAVDP